MSERMTVGVLDGKWYSRPLTTTGIPNRAVFERWKVEGWRTVAFKASRDGRDWSILMEREAQP